MVLGRFFDFPCVLCDSVVHFKVFGLGLVRTITVFCGELRKLERNKLNLRCVEQRFLDRTLIGGTDNCAALFFREVFRQLHGDFHPVESFCLGVVFGRQLQVQTVR